MKYKLIKTTQKLAQWYMVSVPDDWDDDKILDAFEDEDVTCSDPHFEQCDSADTIIDKDPAPCELQSYSKAAYELGVEEP
jgi:hypothetical protein